MKMYLKLVHTYLSERVIYIDDSIGNGCTLILGDEKALLFDTLTGMCDLPSYVKSLTSLPLTVVLSHGHFDHAYGVWQFGEAFIHPLERAVYQESMDSLEEFVENTGCPFPEPLKNRDFPLTFHDLEEGFVFDLGGIHVEAVSLPGHTAGSMGLIVREERMLLMGDAISPQMTLLFPESQPMETYLATLNKAEGLPVDRLAGAHFSKTFPKEAIGRFRECALAAGSVRRMKYSFSPVPRYKGTLWIYRLKDELTDELLCIITPEGYENGLREGLH